jgi:serine/threonine-protein kinase HipA
MTHPATLDVYFGDELVGHLHDSSPIGFNYCDSWLNRAHAWPVAGIPLQPGLNSSKQVQVYFENLLPEGELRAYVAEQRKSSTLFSILLSVAGDTAGAFVILPGGQSIGPAAYEATSWKAIARVLRKTEGSAIDIHSQDARISLAGAQDKTSIAIFEDGLPRLPRGTAPSTHILKPDIKRLSKVWHSAANETIIMQTAANCGLPTAEVVYEPLTQSCLVRRFDRILREDGTLSRLVQYDLCQLAGETSDRKYESEGGPSLASCADLIRRYSTQPAVDLRNFVLWILFNLYVGNNDSHAKNLSVYQTPGQGVIMTPFYDLLCTRIYSGLSPNFAFAIGGETRPGAMTKAHIRLMAEQLNFRPEFVTRQAKELAAKIPSALDQAVLSVSTSVPKSAHFLVDRLRQFVLSNSRKIAARIMDN